MLKICEFAHRILIGAVAAFFLWNASIAPLFINMHLGVILTFLFGLLLLLYCIFFRRIRKGIRTILCNIGECGLIALFLAIFCLFSYGRNHTTNFREEIIIVLGCGLQGREPSATLEARLETALDYEEKNPGNLFIVSGGQGPQEEITEAHAMSDYLTYHYLPRTRIITENHATSTEENFQYSKELLDNAYGDVWYDRSPMVFITNDYHVYRAERIAADVGFPDISYYSSQTPWYLVIPSGLRECLAIVKFWIT